MTNPKMSVEDVLRTLQQYAIDAVLANPEYARVKRQSAIHEPNLTKALADLHKLLISELPGTAIIDWGDFKSQQEKHEYAGYVQAVNDMKETINKLFGKTED